MMPDPLPADPAAVLALDHELDTVVAQLHAARAHWRGSQTRHVEYGAHGFPAWSAVARVVEMLSTALFPIRLGPHHLSRANEDGFVRETLAAALPLLGSQLRMELEYNAAVTGRAVDVEGEVARMVAGLAGRLPAIRRALDTDMEAAYNGDPAARSVDEVLLCYPCVTALTHYRLAHELYLLGAPLVARIIAEQAHSRTGIDIHPGARIGDSFFIDHGTGVVIGQTSIIGNRVRLYQAVTLGARNFATDAEGRLLKEGARHPILEDDVTVYAGATILGRVTIGAGSVIGGNVWLTRSVAPGSHVRQGTPRIEIEQSDPVS